MDINTLKAIIIEGQELLSEVKPVPRAMTLEPNGRYVFVGIRQAGKSYMLYLRALQLISEGHDLKKMLFVNFDDERLMNMTADDLDSILQAYGSLYDKRPILFLDEIQNVEGWEHFARRLANQKYMVYITGSNAKMLSKDIATRLGARYIEQRVFPYSFKEYLLANGCEVDNNWYFGKKSTEVNRLLGQYFQWGGFPESLLYVNKRHWLNELYEKIILGDIIQRNRIKNEQSMRMAIKRLAENIKTPTSFNRLAAMVKATGHSTNVASVIDYVTYCEEACLLFSVENYASKFVERNTVKKHYFVDNGLLNIFLTDSDTALMENICAITLYRNWSGSEENTFYYYNKEVELDFYIPAIGKGIQVCYNLQNPATLEREVKALTTFHRLYGLKEAEIVTYSEEDTIETSGLVIKVTPLSKWLLGEELVGGGGEVGPVVAGGDEVAVGVD
ncbi:MAG: ATP-binding protein [Muribaculaceae bacterium]|nr:ATP-binding protein [Muribaculaceae bacterium]